MMTPSGVDTLMYESDSVTIGRFECRVSHPHFRDTGPIRDAVVVFPRTSVWIRHIGSRPFVADANVVSIYNRGQRYERFPIDPSGDRCDWFALAEPLAREAADAYGAARAGSKGPFQFERAPSTAALYSRQRALVLRAANGELSALEAEEEVLSIVSEVLRLARTHHAATTRSRGRDAPGERLSTVRRRNLAEAARAALASTALQNRSISELAQAVGTSPFHLCRVFREHTGQTMHAYRVGLRLRHAIEQLSTPVDGNLPTFSQVASAVGFASHAHLVRICRRELGITPTGLRSLLRASTPARAGVLRGVSAALVSAAD